MSACLQPFGNEYYGESSSRCGAFGGLASVVAVVLRFEGRAPFSTINYDVSYGRFILVK